VGTGGPFSRVKSGRDVTLTTHPHLFPRSRMSRCYSLPLGARVAISRHLYVLCGIIHVSTNSPTFVRNISRYDEYITHHKEACHRMTVPCDICSVILFATIHLYLRKMSKTAEVACTNSQRIHSEMCVGLYSEKLFWRAQFSSYIQFLRQLRM
jgi:hypothetical protein